MNEYTIRTMDSDDVSLWIGNQDAFTCCDTVEIIECLRALVSSPVKRG